MKKWIKICLVCLMVITLSPAKDVHAEEFTKKTVAIYNNVDSEKMNLDTYIKNDEVYVQLYDLTKMLGFIVKNDQGTITLTKKGKRVTIKDGSIIYGKSKQDLSVIDQDGVIYVPLTPTINYLDARIEMVGNQLVLFKPKITFSEMVSDMEDTINQGYLLIGKDNGWSVSTSYLWMFINGESSSYLPQFRKERVVISLLIEDDIENFEFKDSKMLDIIKESASILETIGFEVEEYDNSFISAVDKNNIIMDGTRGMIESAAVLNQIKHFYGKNILNAENVFFNQDFPLYNKNDYMYILFKKYIDYYYDNMKDVDKELINFSASSMADITTDLLIGKLVPPLSACMSALKIYSSILDLDDQAAVIITKQDYNAIQCKVLNRIAHYNFRIKMGYVLSKEEISDYMNLARMYYHIAAVYYNSMSEVDKEAFEGNYKAAKAVVDDIDLVPYTVYTFDAPMEKPSMIKKEHIDKLITPETEIWQNALRELVVNEKFDKELWDVFNGYQSRIHLEDMDFDGIPEVIVTSEDARDNWKQSYVYRLEDSSYKFKMNFHGMLLGTYDSENEKFFRIETSHAGSFEVYQWINDFDTMNELRFDKFENEYTLNNEKISKDEYQSLKSKFIDQAQKISSLNAASPFYKSFSKEHRKEISRNLISSYNEGEKNTDYADLYEEFDVKMAFIALLDKNGLHTSVPFKDYQFKESDQSIDIYEVKDTQENSKTEYEVHKNTSYGGLEFLLDMKNNVKISI